MATSTQAEQRVFWHRDLPPLDAKALGEHTVEATSQRMASRQVSHDEIWSRCYPSLMQEATRRLEQEIIRLGGDCAHVLHESIDVRHDDAAGEAWLHGRFTYVLYRRTRAA